MHDILMITWNRAHYTRISLERLLESCDEEMRVWVWHNGDDRGTLEVVRELSRHPRFHHLEVSPENLKLREPTNWFWKHADGDYLTKVDDDCQLPDGWGGTLRAAHESNPKLGIIGCWRFYEEDEVPELIERKLMDLAGGHRLLRNCWLQGSGYVMKRACRKDCGLIGESESFTDYCIRAALAGWENGWYYPFIHEEHMDDPRSEFTLIRSDEEFMAQRPLSARVDNVTTLDEWASRVRFMAKAVQAASPDPNAHVGWRLKLTRAQARLKRMAGVREPWRIARRA